MAPRPLMQIVADQQKLLQDQQTANTRLVAQMAAQSSLLDRQAAHMALQERKLDFLARLAGVETQMAALRYTADVNNPADPVPDPGAQAPSESTDQARVPGAYDDPRAPGLTPGSTAGVPAASTDVPMQPGASMPTPPFNQLVDVQAPVAGTEGTTGAPEFGDQAGRDGVTRIETDVRALGIGEEGDQMNPTTAFPWNPNMGPDNGNGVPPATGEMAQGSAGRTMACMRLAKLRIHAGVARGDEFAVCAAIEADPAMTVALIEHELKVLGAVSSSAAPRRPDLVPRRAAAAPPPVVPSMAEAPRMPFTGSRDHDEIEMADFLLDL